jgi:hypothetical protein
LQGKQASTANPFSIALSPGWNMIGDPFPADVPLSTITVDTVPSTTAVPITTSTLVILPLFDYVGGAQVYATLDTNTDSILAGQGYWIFATAPATLIMTPPASIATPLAKGK